MAKGKRFSGIEDPRGEEWQGRAGAAWTRAVEVAERSRQEGEEPEPFSHYEAPALPDFAEDATSVVKGEVLGRFVYQPGTGLVHDVTKAAPGCRVDQERPRVFIHFAHEIEGAVPDEAEPHAACMG